MIYLKERVKKEKTGGNKAREDIEAILEIKNKRFTNKVYKFYCLIEFLFKAFFKKDVIFFQYPNINIVLKIIRILKNKKVIIIHDLEGLRNKDKELFNYEVDFLKKINYIISHNSKMSEELIKMGISKEKIYNLEVFDYLLNSKKIVEKEKTSDICFAGNLGKSPFIYKFDEKFKNIKIDIFGINYDKEKNKGSFNYKGAFPPNIIHEELTGKYGLIWDGDSLQTCNGNMGEYMRYNNPHKLSLYIAAGIPVITWKEAAIAEFIEENNIGITVGSLCELEEYFKNLKSENYDIQVQNTLKIRERIINGEMFKKVLGEINEKLKK